MRWRRQPLKGSETQADTGVVSAEQGPDTSKIDRDGVFLDYFAIHDGRTLNVCVDQKSDVASLILAGPLAVRLEEAESQDQNCAWVVDILALGLQPGAYDLRGIDSRGEELSLVVKSPTTGPKGDPARDGKVVDLHDGRASAVMADGAPAVVIEGDVGVAQLASLNFLGRDSYLLVVPALSGRYSVVANRRESTETVELGTLVASEGELHVTRLRNADDVTETLWDVTVKAESEECQALYGPATDYNRPDQATTFGDLNMVRDGWRYRWKPYISRAGTLSFRVTSEATQDVR